MDAITTSQESLHNIKVRKIEAFVLNLDLVRAYDKVNWVFLTLVILQIEISVEVFNWIMGCVESTNFVVLFREL